MEHIEAAIRQVAVFQDATTEDVRAIASLGFLRKLENGAFFFHQGDPANYLFILLEGLAKLTRLSSDGQQTNLRTIQPNQLFGALGAVTPNAVYPASAEALEDSSSFAIKSQDFNKLLKDRPQLSFGLMQLMTGYIQEMQERYHELATERVQQRIARVLLRLATQSGKKIQAGVLIDLPFSQSDLAEMAGTTLYTVSRVLSALEKQGLISTGRERVTITNPHGLVRLAEDLQP
jgi:CRP/FNR family transcriptional regulator, nitrogen oxide reductase regulator